MTSVATRRWCRIYGCDHEPDESGFCSRHRHAGGLGPQPADGRELLDRLDAGEPVGGLEEAEDSTPRSGAVVAAAVDATDPAPGDSASSSPRPRKWTREKAVAAIREVAEQVGHTPSIAEMGAAGYATVPQLGARFGCRFSDLVREAGFEPNTRATGFLRVKRSGRAASPAPGPRAEEAPVARSDDRLLVTPDAMTGFQRALARALIAGMRAAADALEQELSE